MSPSVGGLYVRTHATIKLDLIDGSYDMGPRMDVSDVCAVVDVGRSEHVRYTTVDVVVLSGKSTGEFGQWIGDDTTWDIYWKALGV